MSENLNRSSQDFSKYDSMSIGELEEILRADAQGPEGDDSDVDEILYVMEVLAKKRRQNGIAGKTALEAYQEFQQHYLPMDKKESKPRRKSNVIPFRRIAAVAASLVFVFTLATSANAFSIKDIWNAVARWAEETFSFSMGVEIREPKANSELEYESLSDILLKNNIIPTFLPTYLPEDYTLADIFISESPLREEYLGIYKNDSNSLKISIKTFAELEPEQIEQSEGFSEKYTHLGIEYYIFSNYDQSRAVWIVDTFEVYISGNITVEQIKMMIDSIEKGN